MNHRRFDIKVSSNGRTLVDVRDFAILPDNVTFLFGESGIGKSLIARTVFGLLDPDEFDIVINEESYGQYLERAETREILENGFYVFQEPSTHLNPLLSIGRQMREGNLSQGAGDLHIMKEMWAADDQEEIAQLLEVYPKPYRPSGGEKQRVFLAMALKKIDMLLNSERRLRHGMFIFDEPTGSLDNHFRDVFLSLLFRRFRQSPFTTLIITHDYSMVGKMAGSFGDVMEHVSFKELRKSGDGLMLKDFQASTYLGWLKQQNKEAFDEFRPSLLRIESGAEIFGQRLCIYKEARGNVEAPLEVFPGSMVYLKAPSGTGKTSLVKMTMGLLRGRNLRLEIDGMALNDTTPESFWQTNIWGRKMTMVFQHADEALNPKSTVAETFRGLPASTKITRDAIRQTLEGLFEPQTVTNILDKPVGSLSGGQKQRLNLLRCLFLETDVLILDEPLNGLDFESSTRVLALLRKKLHEGKGILLISHNEEIFDAVIPDRHVYYLRTGPASK